MIYDAHAHMGTEEERAFRREQQIVTMICAGTPEEGRTLSRLAAGGDRSWIVPAAGLHPWHSGSHTIEEMRPYMERFPVIGEIGMDSVWCQVPMELQRTVFEEQLKLARDLKKPVVLHTKGMEAEIAGLIARYENTYLVHWYSSMEHLEKYLDLDCYFTLGPDLQKNPAVRQVAKQAPLNRLLAETDGLSAVIWSNGDSLPGAISDVLKSSVKWTAGHRGISAETMERRMEENFWRFIKTPLQ